MKTIFDLILLSYIIFSFPRAFANIGWVPSGPPPAPKESIIFEGHSIPVIYRTVGDPQKMSQGSNEDSRIATQEVFRGIKTYTDTFPELSFALEANRNNPNFHWIDLGGGAARAQIESYFTLPTESYPPFSLDQRTLAERETELPQRIKTYDYFESTSGGYKIAPLVQAPYDKVAPIEVMLSAQPIAQYKTTNVSFDPIMDYIVSGEKAENFAAFPTDLIDTYKDWAHKAVELGHHQNINHQLFQDIKAGTIPKADYITDIYGVLTYSVNKFNTLLEMTKLLKKNGTIEFLTTNKHKFYATSDSLKQDPLNLNELLEILQLPGFKSTYGMKATLQRKKGTVELLKELSKRVVRAEVGNPSSYYNPPFEYTIFLDGIEFKRRSGSRFIEKVTLRPLTNQNLSCKNLF